MNKFILFVCVLGFVSCNILSIDETKPSTPNTFHSDTLSITLSVDTLPLLTDEIRVSATKSEEVNDSFYVNHNGVITIESLNGWNITNVTWLRCEDLRMIQLSHKPTKYSYWCGDRICITNISVELIRTY